MSAKTLFDDIEFYQGTKGHADMPGTGPAGQTCGTCAYYTRVCRWRPNRSKHFEYHGKTYRKCGLMRGEWTHGSGTDIRAKDPACTWWRTKQEKTGLQP